jgi:Tfp pilus assembly protein FimT
MKNKKIRLTSLLVGIGCFTFLAQVHAVNPPPDGCYPNFTTAEGCKALQSLTTGSANTAIGWYSLSGTSSGSFNTAVGAGALDLNTGDNNTAVGVAALLLNTTGTDNTANGRAALEFNDTGTENTAVGALALFNNTIGSENTAIGSAALANNSTGALNVALGDTAGSGVTTANNVIVIGTQVAGENVSDTCYIGNIFDQTSSGGAGVYVNLAGKLGTSPSSRRFKDDIRPMDKASEALFSLKPVSFRYKKEIDPAGTSQLGLVAEEVEKVNPDLVVRDKEGKPYSVRYEQVNAMLLNEFLKEHKKVEKLEATVADLATQLRQVSAQLQMNNSSGQVAANHQ